MSFKNRLPTKEDFFLTISGTRLYPNSKFGTPFTKYPVRTYKYITYLASFSPIILELFYSKIIQ